MGEEPAGNASSRRAGDTSDKLKAARPKAAKTARSPQSETDAPSIAEDAAAENLVETANLTISQGGAAEVVAGSVTITHGGANQVEASSVAIRQGGIGTASAEDITVSVGGIGIAHADEIAVRMGGVGLARADRVSSEMGAITMAVGRDVYVTKSGAAAILATEANLRDSGIGSVVASNVKFEGRSAAFIVVARNTEGDIKPVLDWRGAIVACAAIGGCLAVALLARRKRD